MNLLNLSAPIGGGGGGIENDCLGSIDLLLALIVGGLGNSLGMSYVILSLSVVMIIYNLFILYA